MKEHTENATDSNDAEHQYLKPNMKKPANLQTTNSTTTHKMKHDSPQKINLNE